MRLKALTIALVLAAAWVTPAGAALNPNNPETYIYGDNFIGPDGTGTSPIWFGGVQIDFDGYIGARPSETFTIHFFNNNTSVRKIVLLHSGLVAGGPFQKSPVF